MIFIRRRAPHIHSVLRIHVIHQDLDLILRLASPCIIPLISMSCPLTKMTVCGDSHFHFWVQKPHHNMDIVATNILNPQLYLTKLQNENDYDTDKLKRFTSPLPTPNSRFQCELSRRSVQFAPLSTLFNLIRCLTDIVLIRCATNVDLRRLCDI